jgi:short subunit dehydrogenase-like uncharacterized protein
MDREFDLVLYGATGYVGKLTAEYLRQSARAGARIALAGRSQTKLSAVRDQIAVDWELISADADDPDSLRALARRTRVVVTTVGPYAKYGMPLVRACAEAGTHYADLTGEVTFVREAIDRYHETAARTGARIVVSCGYDSVPSDLSVYLLYRQTVADNTGELTDTTLVASMRGGASGGTIASVRTQFEAVAEDRSRLGLLSHPYALSPDKSMEPDVGRQSDSTLQRAAAIDPGLDGWVTTFLMAAHNTKIVRRTNGLLGWPYGKNFRYREVMSAGKSVAAPVFAAAVNGGIAAASVGLVALSRFDAGKRLLDRVLPKPGTGPSERTRANGWFRMKTFAHTTSGAKYLATFAAQGDPGYAATAAMLGEAGLALAFDQLSDIAGVLTPAAAMGEPLTERLRAAGFTITVERM